MQLTRREFISSSSMALAAGCAPKHQASHNADVLILGAGLAGLHAARMLEADGFKVIVLEADTRIGGRMWTLDDLPGRPEAGGQQVGQSYARIRSTALNLGLKMLPPAPGGSRDKTMVLGGRTFDAREWESAPENSFPDPFKRAAPDSALVRAALVTNPLPDQYAWRSAVSDIDISAATYLSRAGFDADALALCDIALNANDLNTYSMVNLWRSLKLYEIDASFGGYEEIAGGSQRLPEAMASSLSDGALQLGTKVSAVRSSGQGVEVVAADRTYHAAFGICALPFSVLRNLELALPEAAAPIKPIITNMPYTQIQQIHLELEQGPSDGLPMMMWTDTPIERVFPIRDRSGETVGLTCWVNGAGIQIATSDEDWKALAEQTLAETRGIKAKAHAVIRWDENQPFSGGAYMHWAPGQIGQWAERITRPSGRLHFAGEHTSYLHTGMEGAMESGERAAYAIIEAVAGSAA